MDTLSILIFTLLLSGQASNDLLDLVPADAYWKSKDVEMTAANIMLELNSIKPDDTSKAVAVRRLMAIRTLGELKSPDALSSLKSQLDSKEMFVADYAQRAIDTIQGKAPARTSGVPPDKMKADLYMLPEQCGIVAQARLSRGNPVAYPKPKEADEAAGGDAQSQLIQLANQIIYIAELTGNIRVDSVTLGVSADVGPNVGFVVIYARGQWDAEAIRSALQPTFSLNKTAGEIDFMVPTFGAMALAVPSNELFAMMAYPPNMTGPLDDVGAAIKSGKGGFASSADLSKLVDDLNATDSIFTQPIWAASIIGDSYRQAPQLVPFDTMTLVTKPIDGGLKYFARATGKEADAMKNGVEQLTGLINEVRDELSRQAESTPSVAPLADFIKSIELKSEGTTATGIAVMKKPQ